MLLTITGCSNKQVGNINYTFKGENESWAAEYQVKGTLTSSKLFGQINVDSDLAKTLIVTYKKDISQLSSVKYLEISYEVEDDREENALKGKTLIENYNNDSHAQKTYTLNSHTTGSRIEVGNDIIKVTINIDNQIQTIKLKNEQYGNEGNSVKSHVIVDPSLAVIPGRNDVLTCT